MSVCASSDRYTPCAPRPMEQYARRKTRNDSFATQPANYILQQLSSSVSLQETRVSDLMRNLDIAPESLGNGPRTPDSSSSLCSTPELPHPPFPSDIQQASETDAVAHGLSRSRPGRLSPTTIQMILSQNNSLVLSEASSGADTSYDSGLYQWLGIDGFSQSSKILHDYPFLSNMQPDASECGPEASTSTSSSQSVYSQSSPVPSLGNRIIPPLSPPATARPPFSELLHSEEPEARLPVGHRASLDAQVVTPLLARTRSIACGRREEYDTILHDFSVPMLLKNLSLQHYMPSATVLRHFQQVVDELRGKYVPNDEGNNASKCEKRSSLQSARRSTLMSAHSLTGALQFPPSPLSPSCQSDQATDVMLQSDVPPKIRGSQSRVTRELYTEMAVMLFIQAEEAEAHVDALRCLVTRLDNVANMKRRAALVLGMRGKGREDCKT